MANSNGKVIFTDLDGTLIDFTTYCGEVTKPALHQLIETGHQVVFCSSKTLSEQVHLMREMQVCVPAILENGGGIAIPYHLVDTHIAQAQVIRSDGLSFFLVPCGPDANQIRSILHQAESILPLDLGLYIDIGPQNISALTGLTVGSAIRAMERSFSETITAPLGPNQVEVLQAYLSQHGLQLSSGGRFHTVTGSASDKGTAIGEMMDILRQHSTSITVHTQTIGIGDAPNDASMLATVDVAYLVQNHQGGWCVPSQSIPGLKLVAAIGPQGWNAAVAPLITGKPTAALQSTAGMRAPETLTPPP